MSILLKNEKECIYCGKIIKKHAVRCKYCKMYQTTVTPDNDKKTKVNWLIKFFRKL